MRGAEEYPQKKNKMQATIHTCPPGRFPRKYLVCLILFLFLLRKDIAILNEDSLPMFNRCSIMGLVAAYLNFLSQMIAIPAFCQHISKVGSQNRGFSLFPLYSVWGPSSLEHLGGGHAAGSEPFWVRQRRTMSPFGGPWRFSVLQSPSCPKGAFFTLLR